MVVYLNQYQMRTYKRTIEPANNLKGISISEGTIFNAIKSAYNALETSEDKIFAKLIATPVKHADETGLRIQGKRQWLYVVSTDKCNYYGCHPKLSKEATDDIGSLSQAKGVVGHDYCRSYYKINFDHSLCNTHHLRELTGIMELSGQSWSQEMIDLLLEIKEV